MATVHKTKIVATLGPTSASQETVGALVEAGVDVFRFNFSHGTHAEHRRAYNFVKTAANEHNRFVAILGDLCGPKIRVGRVRNGSIDLRTGGSVDIICRQVVGDETQISTSYQHLHKDVQRGDSILLDDGRIHLIVESVADEIIHCDIVVGGVLSDNKGMNIPGTALSVSALTEKDRDDIELACELKFDYLALSFVRSASDVLEAKALADDIPIIAKIEKPEAIHNIEEIIEASDGIMVARGDLGVEAGAEKVPLLQKRIVRDATAVGRPVIVATQMMESMIVNPEPTRAEVSDVANAVLDGADAVMLSGETAVGRFPVETVKRMASIIEEVETSDLLRIKKQVVRSNEHLFSSAIADAAVSASRDFGLKAIAVYTETGHSGELVSANRPPVTIVALSRHFSVLQRLALRWGVIPRRTECLSDSDTIVDQTTRLLKGEEFVKIGDTVAIAFGLSTARGLFQTDTLKLVEIA